MGKAMRWLIALLLVVGLIALSGVFLVVDNRQHADVIVVLAGETDRRPALALELLQQGYAPRMVLDVPAQDRLYKWSQAELAKEYVESLPQASAISVCPIYGLSTRDETGDVSRCLQPGEHNVLLVTSDYHSRRALDIFKQRLPDHRFSVAASHDPTAYGTRWWSHRQWAKIHFDEWARLLWWEIVERWR